VTTMSKTISEFLDQDIADGEVKIVGMLASPTTGPWALCEVLKPEGTDKFRAYPNQNFANTIGLICQCAASLQQVTDEALRWS